MKFQIDSNSFIVRNSNQLYSEIDKEVVMLNIKKEEYYNLDTISSDIWHRLAEPTKFEDLVDYLLNSYDVNRDTCIADTTECLKEFSEKDLIKIINEK